MSTSDKVVANDTFPTLRADLNVQLAAIASQQAGTADPSAMLAYERQARTDLGQLRRRNAANAGWILDGTLAETYLLARSSNTILAGANHQCAIIGTGTYTQTFTAAATLGDGWWVNYRNDGAGIITLDANASELIDGVTTQVLNPGDSCKIMCNGSAFKTIGRTAISAKVGTFTRALDAASGAVAYSGVGFIPRVVLFFAASSTVGQASWGWASGAGGMDIDDIHNITANANNITTTTVIVFHQASGLNQSAVMTNFDNDGFTLTWTRTGATAAGTGTVTYLALR